MKSNIGSVLLIIIGVLLVLFAFLFYPIIPPKEYGIADVAAQLVSTEGPRALESLGGEALSQKVDLNTPLPDSLAVKMQPLGMTDEQLRTISVARNVGLQDTLTLTFATVIMSAQVIFGLVICFAGLGLIIGGLRVWRKQQPQTDTDDIVDEINSLRARLQEIEDKTSM